MSISVSLGRQKQQVSAELTDVLKRIALKPKSCTHIAFYELPEENCAIPGQLLDEA